MVEPDEIVCVAERMLMSGPPFSGKHVVVTAGPTREPMDPVRVITNRSSGRMGYALARAAWRRGASVTLIAGPGGLPDPHGVKVVRVETTEEMKAAVGDSLAAADCLIMAAAPADYAPGKVSAQKTKRDAGPVNVVMEPTADILASTAYWRRSSSVIVGFALETHNMIESAKEKLIKKNLDLIVANDATATEAKESTVTLITAKTVEPLEKMTKEAAAEAILDRVGVLMGSKK